MLILKSALIVSLLFLLYQDFKFRAVYWLVFPIVFLLLLAVSFSSGVSIKQTLQNVLLNNAFVAFQLFIVTIYFSIKQKQWIWITKELIGWGDLLFLISISACLSTISYLLFYITSLLFTLLVSVPFILSKSSKSFKVPMAGIQAGFFAMVLLFDWSSTLIDLSSDQWLFNVMAI
ncbi:MAG: hypothetical protein JWQ25_12 [Daejeonella sp.]|nr:hypothetical protein [Daejeonella sp.]